MTKYVEHRIVLIYDSIGNTVFNSQVLNPLITWQQAHKKRKATIISCEKGFNKSVEQRDYITIVKIPRIVYVGTLSLLPSYITAQEYINKQVAYNKPYEIIARGPFAGALALWLHLPNCQRIIIQVRGLAAQEYAYIQQTQKKTSWLSKVRARQFERLEQFVYSRQNRHVHFEAVSPALKEYLINKYKPSSTRIDIAQEDVPAIIDKTTRTTYRTNIRKQLGITEDMIVYCYNGSYKSWQCPEHTIRYFRMQLACNIKSFLLILSPDIIAFQRLLQDTHIPKSHYKILHVAQQELYQFLAAADKGILLRMPHIINHVARPTKALDYQAVGLTIIHNDTVSFMKQLPQSHQEIVSLP